MRCIVVVSFVILVGCDLVPSYELNRTLDGYPNGYVTTCPGLEKPTIVSKRSLKQLTLAVQGPGIPFIANRTTYTYFQMRKLAKDHRIDWRRRTIVYVGGYLDNPNIIFARLLGKLYNQWNYNVLLLDTNFFTAFYYPVAARNMRVVGKHTAEMLVKLLYEGLDPSKLELIGLSLGGQTISFIAKNFREMTGRNVSRLTALDPSGPCFRTLGPEKRLDASDADFVDVIATNIDGFGMPSPIGHINIYVNGGEFQPGDFAILPCNVLCSHLRSYTIWVAAMMYPDKFVAIKCDNVQQARDHTCYDRKPMETNLLGLNVDKTKQGIYYLATDHVFPYYLGEAGTRRENKFWDNRIAEYNTQDVITL